MRLDWPEATPYWLREVDRLLESKGELLLHGNTKDILFYPALKRSASETPEPASESSVLQSWPWRRNPLRDVLFDYFRSANMQVVASYNPIDGMTFADPSMADRFSAAVVDAEKATAKTPSGVPQPSQINDPVEKALQQIRLAVSNSTISSAVVIEFGSQLISGPTHLDRDQRTGFLRILKAGIEAGRVPGARLRNCLILVCDKLTDLPPWLLLNNPSVGSVEVQRPSSKERRHFFSTFLGSHHQIDVTELADLTEGMTFRDLVGVWSLAMRPGGATVSKRLVDEFKFGQQESQWDTVLPRLRDAEETLGARVIGQPAAVAAVADVLRRASLHLSGAHHSGRTKPRGVLFFAGPTGVGKTEMAKAIAEVVFGSEDACVRFDMSEFSQSHSGDRLLGAPPGYVGYEEGGQLTNRMKSNPFSVLLFDEIEKADPSILDKFLQILEDGRMTDGRGETVYFGESIMVFTSNAGIYEIDPHTGRAALDPVTNKPVLRVEPQTVTSYPEIRQRITEGVHDYFKHFLGRPELLNRIGQNIVVFDFVRKPTMRLILEHKVLPAICRQVAERIKVEVVFLPTLIDQMLEAASADVGSGGRGVGNLAEAALLNPLARMLFAEIARGVAIEGRRIEVRRILKPDATNNFQFGLDAEFCDVA